MSFLCFDIRFLFNFNSIYIQLVDLLFLKWFVPINQTIESA